MTGKALGLVMPGESLLLFLIIRELQEGFWSGGRDSLEGRARVGRGGKKKRDVEGPHWCEERPPGVLRAEKNGDG